MNLGRLKDFRDMINWYEELRTEGVTVRKACKDIYNFYKKCVECGKDSEVSYYCEDCWYAR